MDPVKFAKSPDLFLSFVSLNESVYRFKGLITHKLPVRMTDGGMFWTGVTYFEARKICIF